VDLELIELKRKLLMEKKKEDVEKKETPIVVVEQPKESEPIPEDKKFQSKIPVRKCFRCEKGIKTDDFMESGEYLYHEECFICYKCDKLIDGPFKNTEGVLICKPCTIIKPPQKQESPKIQTLPNLQPTQPKGFICGGCNEEILPGRVKLKAIEKYYHSECFKCQKCQNEFENKKFFNLDGVPV